MAQKILELEITANTDKLKKGLEDSKKALREFNAEASKSGGEYLKQQLNDARVEAVKFASELKGSLSESLNNAKIYTENARKTTESYKQTLLSSKSALDETRRATEEQRKATEQERTQLARTRAAQALLTLEKRKSQTQTTALAGSYREAQQRLTALGKSIREAEGGFAGSNNNLSNQIKEYNELNTRLKTFDSTLGNHQRNVGNYASGLANANGVAMEFNRIIQDAPFGMMGVGNNIQQLTSNWQQYAEASRKAAAEQGKTVTTGALLRGALSSLVTPAGLLTLAVSAVTSGWVIYEKWAQRSAKATREKKDETVKYIDTLKGLARAQADGQVGAQKDLTNLRLMYQATQDINIPMEKRREIAEQLIKQYPKQFEGLSKEAILAGTASKAYDSLTKSITATALASAYASKITENASKQLSNYLEILDKQNEANKLRTSIEKTRANFTTSALGAGVGASGASQSGAVARDVERVNNLMKEINSLGSENSKITNENRLLQQNYNTQLVNGADATGALSTGLDNVKDTTKSLVNDITKLTETLDYFGKTSGLSFFDAKLFDVNEKLRESLELIEKARRANKITSAEADRLTLLAEQTKEFEKQEVIMARFLDSAKKLQTLTGRTSGVGLSGSLTVPNQLPNLERNQFIINARQRNNTSSTQDKDDAKLENRISKVIESGFRQGISSILGDITNLGSNFQQVFSNVFNNLAQSMSSILNNVVGTYLGDLFKKKLDDVDFSGLGNKASKAIIAGLGTAGSLVSGLSSKTSSFGQGLGGALSGAAMGATLGPVGAVVGGILGGVAGLFGAKKARKERELQEAQLREQEKQTKLQERIANLTYTSSIVGQVTNQGTLQSLDRNEFGDIIGRVNGKDIVLVVDRTRSGG